MEYWARLGCHLPVAFVVWALNALAIVIIADAVLSWIVRDPTKFPRNITSTLTAPLYKPIHMILNPAKTGGIDFSPIILILGLQALANYLSRMT